jgi:hypothetical protein
MTPDDRIYTTRLGSIILSDLSKSAQRMSVQLRHKERLRYGEDPDGILRSMSKGTTNTAWHAITGKAWGNVHPGDIKADR